MKQKPYSDEDNTRTDVNGAWKPLKPLQEGYEFIGDDQYDNFLTKKGKERRDLRKDLRGSGLSRKDARKQAKSQIPTSKPARRDAYLLLVSYNFRGFAWKLNSIITGSNQKLIADLKDKWRKWGSWDELIRAVNKGKDKKPHVCGAKCREGILDTQNNNFVVTASVATIVSGALALAGVIISSLSGIIKQAQIGKQQENAIKLAEKEGEDDFNKLPPEKKQEIIDAENQLKNEVDSSDKKKYIWMGVGVLAFVAIILISKKSKK